MHSWKIEYQLNENEGVDICIAKNNGDFIASCGPGGNQECEDNAQKIILAINSLKEVSETFKRMEFECHLTDDDYILWEKIDDLLNH